ncbi:MAG: hypothetical protein Q8S17_05730 [Humidesulfovibrio sp.]|nr:hypothetical protein [Humidesulfovibrio sp.]
MLSAADVAWTACPASGSMEVERCLSACVPVHSGESRRSGPRQSREEPGGKPGEAAAHPVRAGSAEGPKPPAPVRSRRPLKQRPPADSAALLRNVHTLAQKHDASALDICALQQTAFERPGIWNVEREV